MRTYGVYRKGDYARNWMRKIRQQEQATERQAAKDGKWPEPKEKAAEPTKHGTAPLAL